MNSIQKPSGMPIHRYLPYQQIVAVDLPDRTWPTRTITTAPQRNPGGKVGSSMLAPVLSAGRPGDQPAARSVVGCRASTRGSGRSTPSLQFGSS